MVRRYLYMVTTIVAALWRSGLGREPARRIRRRLSPLRVQGEARPGWWASLARWTEQRERLCPQAAPSMQRAVDATLAPPVSDERMAQVLELRAERNVKKDSTLQWHGKTYEVVGRYLAGRTVTAISSLLDPSRLRLEHLGLRRYAEMILPCSDRSGQGRISDEGRGPVRG